MAQPVTGTTLAETVTGISLNKQMQTWQDLPAVPTEAQHNKATLILYTSVHKTHKIPASFDNPCACPLQLALSCILAFKRITH